MPLVERRFARREISRPQSRPPQVRKKRQQDASLGLMDLTRVKDDDAEILDDRCYFPVVNVDMTLADKYADALPMLKQVTGRHRHRHRHHRHRHRHRLTSQK